MMLRATLILLTFVAGWMAQALFLYFAPAHLPAPHWLLLVVLAVGSGGRIYTSMGLGFFWGLALDVYGQTPFGAQGALMALAGYVAGTLARHINAHKLVAQVTLALGGTLVYLIGVGWLQNTFHPVLGLRPLGAGLVLGELMLNALTAPAVFWSVLFLMNWGHNGKDSRGTP